MPSPILAPGFEGIKDIKEEICFQPGAITFLSNDDKVRVRLGLADFIIVSTIFPDSPLVQFSTYLADPPYPH